MPSSTDERATPPLAAHTRDTTRAPWLPAKHSRAESSPADHTAAPAASPLAANRPAAAAGSTRPLLLLLLPLPQDSPGIQGILAPAAAAAVGRLAGVLAAAWRAALLLQAPPLLCPCPHRHHHHLQCAVVLPCHLHGPCC